MSARRILLALVGTVAACGALSAQPPGAGQAECRELDPVARDFHLGRLIDPVAPARTARTAVSATMRTTFRTVTAGVHETGMLEMTIPLGTVPSGDLE